MKDDVMSEVRAILRNDLGAFNLEQVGVEDYLFEGHDWEVELEFSEVDWNVLVSREEDDEMKTVGWKTAEEHEIPTVLREILQDLN